MLIHDIKGAACEKTDPKTYDNCFVLVSSLVGL